MSLSLPSMANARESGLRSLRVSDESYYKDAPYIAMLAAPKNKPGPRPERIASSSTLSTLGGTSTSSLRIADGLVRRPPAKPTKRFQLDPLQVETAEEELQAKRRVYKLRNELAKSRSMAAIMQTRAMNMCIGEEVRQETKRLQGAHLQGSVAKVPPASDAEVGKIATALMRKLASTEPDPANRTWFKLFKKFDENGGACKALSSEPPSCTHTWTWL